MPDNNLMGTDNMKNRNDTQFVSVSQPADTFQAGIIRGALENENIICYVNNENTASTHFGGIGLGAASMAVMVPENQAEQAVEIIKGLGIE
jgi:hypothetical protein